MRKSGCIGLYDSGVGGLTVVRELARLLPWESVVYFGDTARMPYGNRSVEEITRFGREIGLFLADQGVKMILVACNTSSALALDILAVELPIPILGVIDSGAEAAARATVAGRVGVMATEATAKSGAYMRAIQTIQPRTRVWTQGCPDLVPLVEAGRIDGPEVRETVAGYLRPLLAGDVDALVYGCTHYPFLDRVVADLAGPGVARVDPAAFLVARAEEMLRREDAMADAKILPDRFITSGSPERFRALGSFFLGRTLPPVERINLEGYGMAFGMVSQ